MPFSRLRFLGYNLKPVYVDSWNGFRGKRIQDPASHGLLMEVLLNDMRMFLGGLGRPELRSWRDADAEAYLQNEVSKFCIEMVTEPVLPGLVVQWSSL